MMESDIKNESNQDVKLPLNDVYVSVTGSDEGDGTILKPFQTISKAINNVSENGTVHISNGIYQGKLNTTVTLTKNVNIINDNQIPGEGKQVIINGNSQTPIFITQGVNTINIKGLVFTRSKSHIGSALAIHKGKVIVSDCTFSENTANISGGAIANAGDLTLSNCLFNSNSVGDNGSGGAIANFGSLTVQNCKFDSNSAGYDNNGAGGAIMNLGNLVISTTFFNTNSAGYNEGGSGGAIANLGDITATNCGFYSNLAGKKLGGLGGGGAITHVQGKVELHDCTFTNNAAGAGAGAIYSQSDLYIFNSIFENNQAMNYGGAIVNTNIMSMVSSNATGNSANYGGFIDNYMGTCDITDSIFTKNHADINGGAFYGTETSKTSIRGSSLTNDNASMDGGAIYNRGEFKIDDAVITSNEAMHGGGVYNNDEGFLKLTASKITQNIAKTSGGGVYNLGKFDKSHSSIVDNKPDDEDPMDIKELVAKVKVLSQKVDSWATKINEAGTKSNEALDTAKNAQKDVTALDSTFKTFKKDEYGVLLNDFKDLKYNDYDVFKNATKGDITKIFGQLHNIITNPTNIEHYPGQVKGVNNVVFTGDKSQFAAIMGIIKVSLNNNIKMKGYESSNELKYPESKIEPNAIVFAPIPPTNITSERDTITFFATGADLKNLKDENIQILIHDAAGTHAFDVKGLTTPVYCPDHEMYAISLKKNIPQTTYIDQIGLKINSNTPFTINVNCFVIWEPKTLYLSIKDYSKTLNSVTYVSVDETGRKITPADISGKKDEMLMLPEGLISLRDDSGKYVSVYSQSITKE